MPAILCIETSASVCSVAVVSDKGTFHVESPKTLAHAEVLSDLIMDCLKTAGMNIKMLDAVAISEGPGSYTGLRIGTSTAKGLCFGLAIPLIPISTLKIIASSALKMGATGLVWPMIDARRMEVYHCVFDQNLQPVAKVENGIITEQGFRPSVVDGSTVICGDGAAKAESILNLTRIDVKADASSMCPLAMEAYLAGNFADLERFEPFYLKPANITSSTKH